MNLHPASVRDQDTRPHRGRQTDRPKRPRHSRSRSVLLLFPHAIKTTPWVTVISGCLAGTAILAALTYVAREYHSPIGFTTVRYCFLPAIVTLAFVPRTLFRPLTAATPVPAWLTAAIQTVLALAVVSLTCWAQLRLMDYTFPSHTAGPAIYPLLAQLTGWSAIFVAVAACCDRSRFADIGGAIAVPISGAAIAFASFTPAVKDLFVTPPATLRAATIAWYILAATALAVAYMAMRDRWHRYTCIRPRRKAAISG